MRHVAAVIIALLALAGSPPAVGQEAKRFFPADPPGMPVVHLPDPLTTAAGRKIATAEEWTKTRRPEILDLFRGHVYGRAPETPWRSRFKLVNQDPRAMGGAATLRQVEITVASGSKSLAIHLALFIPNAAPRPVSAFVLLGHREAKTIDPTRKETSGFWPAEEIVGRGYAAAVFPTDDVDPDKADGFRDGVHGLLDGGRRAPDAWGTLGAWAWGASRVLDYFETDKDLARDRVAVIGHSRGGKAALWAGAQDERFALVCSNESGCGGAALSRRRFDGRESVARINKAFPHWFGEAFKAYGDHEDTLPVDQHLLIALIAPRAVYVASAEEDLWADPRGEFLSVVHAAPVYALFGKKALGATEMPPIGEPLRGDRAAYHVREGKHDLTPFDWACYLDFADQVFSRGR